MDSTSEPQEFILPLELQFSMRKAEIQAQDMTWEELHAALLNLYHQRLLEWQAVKEIMTNPRKYGFIFETPDLYKSVPIRKVGWDKPISNIANFARDQGINYKVLKIFNPWLIQNHLNNKSRKYYEIYIPLEGYH